MDVAFYLFLAAFVLILEYRILRGLWDARKRAEWADWMKKKWEQVK